MREKSAKMEAGLNNFTQAIFGRERTNSECVTCGSKQVIPCDFHNTISYKEFGISRMCQKCQDGVFGTDPEE